jgi:HD-GYP domain-containing protein (c-di-GMP phosphodiesterase class II)
MFRTLSIRLHVLINLFVIVGLIVVSLLGMQYYFSQKLALSATHNNFTQTAQQIAKIFKNGDTNIRNMLYFTELYPDLNMAPKEPKNLETIDRFTTNMRRLPGVYAMYVGHPNGDLFEVVNMRSSSALQKHFQAPPETRWTVIRVFESPEGRVRRFDHLNDHLALLSSRKEHTDYVASKRPWFIQATQSDKPIRTDPYLFSNLDQQGITYSKAVEDTDVVLAIDFTLTELNNALKKQVLDPSSEVMMFGKKGDVIASSSGQIKDHKVDTILTRGLEEGKTDQVFRYKDNGSEKFAMVSGLTKEMNIDTYIGITIDADVILEPYMEQIHYSIAIAVFFLLLTIPFIIYSTGRIIRPINALLLENDKIKERHFDEVGLVDTNITELKDLSGSLVSMAESIQEYQKAQAELMDAFIKLIADAIDAKSAYTGGHCQRVPELAMILAKEADKVEEGPFKSFRFEDDDAWREFETGAWLHDCGKVTTPEYVVDKATKLETIHNRIHEIRTRFEVIWRDIEIEAYERRLKGEEEKRVVSWKEEMHQSLVDDFNFVAECNIGGEFMSQEKRERIKQIAETVWIRHFDDRAGISDAELLRYEGVEEIPVPAREKLLGDRPEHIVKRIDFDAEGYRKEGFKLEVPEHLYNYGEVYNLCIEKGTLTHEERFKIQEHVIMTIKMLEHLPYPENMKRIPEYAGTHHETMTGTGYPRQLYASELSVPARIMVIADIFEALTASDRPYKKGKRLSEAIEIMSYMKNDEHIDAELFELFLTSGSYLEYAKRYLKPEQVDAVDIQTYL